MHREVQAFFSYARSYAEDFSNEHEQLREHLLRRIRQALGENRFRFWIDDTGMPLGEELSPSISRALAGSDMLIMMLSPQWLASEHCRREYSEFFQGRNSSAIAFVINGQDRFGPSVEAAHADILKDIRKRHYASITREEISKALDVSSPFAINSAFDRLLKPTLDLLIPCIEQLAGTPPIRPTGAGPVTVARTQSRQIGGIDFDFVEIAPGTREITLSYGPKAIVSFVQPFWVTTRAVSAREIAAAAGIAATDMSPRELRNALEHLSARGSPVALISESQWEYAVLGGTGPHAEAPVITPSSKTFELVADSYDRPVRAGADRDGRARRVATGQQVLLAAVGGGIDRQRQDENAPLGPVCFRLVIDR